MSKKRANPRRRAGVIDVAAEGQRCERAAAAILDFAASTDVPEFLRDTVRGALSEAAGRKGFPAPRFDGPRAEQIASLSDLCAVTRGVFTLERDDADALAFHLSEVLRLARNPDLVSADFYNAVGEAYNDYIVNPALRDSDGFEFVQFALTRIAPRGKGGEDKAA